MTSRMYLGSGDVCRLLSGINTKGHHELLKEFVSGCKPYYNAKSSPLDALRTGAILEERYALTLPDDYYPQYVVTCNNMDVFRASLDFAQINNGKVVDFDEVKCIGFDDFLELQSIDGTNIIHYIKRKYKQYFNQVQEQLMCAGIRSANLVFVCVYSYDDEVNYHRNIQPNEVLKVRIEEDDEVIGTIMERGQIFQKIKNTYKK